MTRFTLAHASLIGAAAGIMIASLAAPASAQARIYPQGTDCAAMQTAIERLECTQQLGRREEQQSNQLTIQTEPPAQRGLGLDDGGGGTQAPVVPNNGVGVPNGVNGTGTSQ